jgi:hypothetical protein
VVPHFVRAIDKICRTSRQVGISRLKKPMKSIGLCQNPLGMTIAHFNDGGHVRASKSSKPVKSRS